MHLLLKPNILIYWLRRIKVKPLSYIKILLINPMLLAPILIILLKIIVNGYAIILRVKVYNI